MWCFLVLSSAAASRVRLQLYPSFPSHEPPGRAGPGASSRAFSALQKPEHEPVTDTALNFTFRMDDFMTGTERWHARPYVHHSRGDDQAGVQFALLSYDWREEGRTKESGRMPARDYVRPLPDADQRQSLLRGPLRELSRECQAGRLARVTVLIHGYVPPKSGGRPGDWQEVAGRLLVEGGRGRDAAVLVDWSHAAFSEWGDCRSAVAHSLLGAKGWTLLRERGQELLRACIVNSTGSWGDCWGGLGEDLVHALSEYVSIRAGNACKPGPSSTRQDCFRSLGWSSLVELSKSSWRALETCVTSSNSTSRHCFSGLDEKSLYAFVRNASSSALGPSLLSKEGLQASGSSLLSEEGLHASDASISSLLSEEGWHALDACMEHSTATWRDCWSELGNSLLRVLSENWPAVHAGIRKAEGQALAPWYACVDTFTQAMSNTRVVGKYIQRLVAAIHDALETVTISCVGHSLGAHVCGFVGKYLQLEPSPKGELRMARISGLDPAGPTSTGEWAEWIHMKTDGSSWTNMEYRRARLSRTDADFVDVYVTDAGNDGYNMTNAVEKEGRESMTEDDMLGHAVFLVNDRFYQENGRMHPGSENTRESHRKAVELYKQTLQERAETAHWLDGQEEEVKSKRAKMALGIVMVCMLAITFVSCTQWHRASLIFCLLGCLAIGIYYRPPQLMQDACSYQKPHRVQQCKLPLPATQHGANGTCEASRAQDAQFGICASHTSADGLLLYND